MKKITEGMMVAAGVATLFAAGVANADHHHKKGHDGDHHVNCRGVNNCKGHGACQGADNSCAGKNGCKGKGWVKMSEKECKDKGGHPVEGGHGDHH